MIIGECENFEIIKKIIKNSTVCDIAEYFEKVLSLELSKDIDNSIRFQDYLK